MYNELYWPPIETSFRNPDRFVLMFAPITRTYSRSLADAAAFDPEKLPAFVRNKCVMPKSVEENLAWLREWQKHFKGDSFDFDYHYMWDHHKDAAHMSMNRVLFDDMKALRSIGLNGMMSCQNQRVWIPSGFGMAAMAQALWNNQADYDETANAYFKTAFGNDGLKARAYLETLSRLLSPEYLRGETGAVSPAAAESYASVSAHTQAFAPVISENLAQPLLPAQKKSWEYLEYHRNYSVLFAACFQKRAEGNLTEARRLFDSFIAYIRENESRYPDGLDVHIMHSTLSRLFPET